MGHCCCPLRKLKDQDPRWPNRVASGGYAMRWRKWSKRKGGIKDARDAKTESAARRLGLREAGTAAIIADRLRRVRQSRGLSPSGGGQTTCVTEQRTTSLTWNGWLGGQLQLRTQTKQTREETKKKKTKKNRETSKCLGRFQPGHLGKKGDGPAFVCLVSCVSVFVCVSLSPSECVSYSVVSPRLSVC